jgi:hypothetical protein
MAPRNKGKSPGLLRVSSINFQINRNMNYPKVIHACLVLAIAVLMAAGCKKADEVVDNSVPTSLEGSWEVRASSIKFTDLSTTPPTVLEQKDTTFPSGTNVFFMFRADNTYQTRNSASDAAVKDSGFAVLFSSNTKLALHSTYSTRPPDTFNFAFGPRSFILGMIDTTSGIIAQSTFTCEKR